MEILKFISEILVEVVSGTFVIISTYISVRYKRLSDQKETEIKVLKTDLKQTQFQADGINALLDIQTYNNINSGISDIFAHTQTTGFLILIAENGKTKPNSVSVIFQSFPEGLRQNNKFIINAISRYHRISVDKYYSEILSILERDGEYSFVVDNEPDQDLKAFYSAEGIKHSMLKWIDRRPKDDVNDILFFASVYSHKGIYTSQELAVIKASFGRIRAAVKQQFN